MKLSPEQLDALTAGYKTPEEMETLYSQMLQHMINRSLEAEMQAHLGHERHGTAGGTAIFVNQHRSSYFKKYQTGKKHLHGYIYSGRRGHSYYGIIEKSKTEALVLSEGFELLRSWCVGESNIIEATTN